MKSIPKLIRHLAIGAAALVGSQLTAQTGDSLVEVTVSGGNGTPLTVQLPRAVTFTNVPVGLDQYGFVLIGAAEGNTEYSLAAHTGTMGWNSTGSAGDFSARGIMGTTDVGDLTRSHIFAYWPSTGNQEATTGTMTLSAGTRTTDGDVFVNPIVGTGKYQIRMINIDGSIGFIGDPGTQLAAPVEVRILGGGGTPVTIQLLRDITFTNVPEGRGQYGFVLVGAAEGNTAHSFSRHTGTLDWDGTGSDSGGGLAGTSNLGDSTFEELFVSWDTSGNQPRTSRTMTLACGHSCDGRRY